MNYQFVGHELGGRGADLQEMKRDHQRLESTHTQFRATTEKKLDDLSARVSRIEIDVVDQQEA